MKIGEMMAHSEAAFSSVCSDKLCSQLAFVRCARSSVLCPRRSEGARPRFRSRCIVHYCKAPYEFSMRRERCKSRAIIRDCGVSSPVIGEVVISHFWRCFRHLEHILKAVLQGIDYSYSRERPLETPSHGLLLSRSSLRTLGHQHWRMTSLARLLGRILLAGVIWTCVSLQPLEQLAERAFAATSPADVDTTTQASEDFYDLLLNQLRKKDQEMGGVDSQVELHLKLEELHKKVVEQKERSVAAKRALEELRESKSDLQHISPLQERLWSLLDKTFEDFKGTLKGKLESVKDLSPFEEELRKLFNGKFADLQALSKRLTPSERDVLLENKVRELIDEMRVAQRGLEIKALRERREACKHLKRDESKLKDNLTKLFKMHFILQRRFEASVKTDDKQLLDLESEIEADICKWLNVKASLWQKESGNLQEVFIKLPLLERQLEEGLLSYFKDGRTVSLFQTTDEREEQEKVSSDLIKVLNVIYEHKYLPNSLDFESPKAVADESILMYVDSLKDDENLTEEFLEIIDKVVREDMEMMKSNVDKSMKQGNVVAPGLENLKADFNKELKQFLEQNPEIGRQYAAEKQKRILTFRDRVLAKTWYNEKFGRWEISSYGLKYAVDKGMIAGARVRHDKRAMLFQLKGDARTFFADLLAFDAEYLSYGGFSALYMKMLGSGVQAPIVYTPVPLRELDPIRVFLYPFGLLTHKIGEFFKGFVDNPLTLSFFQFCTDTIALTLGKAIFPLLEKLPNHTQLFIGLQAPENVGTRTRRKTPYLMAFKGIIDNRLEEEFGQADGNTAWWLVLPFRWFLMWIPFVYAGKLLGKVFGHIFGPGEDMNDVEWKQKKGKEIMKKLKANNPKAIEDPVRQVFDRMKRVKDPDLKLDEFAGLEMIKEEINEIIKFLREPEIFKEMGARPPRGVLITGEPGTGKTSLAIAIAAEARVPLIQMNGLELEGGAWVGQGASNVRELFKTARELAPLIILMDDFDYFAGVRGESGDTRKQDHESLINQLLVELDGFETQKGVVLIATSSRPETIDEALRRPGRMDRTIALPMPNKSEREIILKKAAAEVMDDDLIHLVDWKEMARKTAGMTPQQLREVPDGLEATFASWKYTDDEELFFFFNWLVKLNRITPDWLANSKLMFRWKSSLRDWLGLRITKEDVEAAVACIDVFNETRPGIEYENPGYEWTREFKYPHAVWAVGRGLVGALLPDYDVLENIWLDQGSWEGIGFTRFSKRQEGGYEETSTLTRVYYEKKLVHCFGSTIAAELLLPYGQNNDLNYHELEEAAKIARKMVMELGWGPDNGQTVYFAPGAIASLGMGDEMEMVQDQKIDMIYNAARDKAAEMIKRNRHVLNALLDHLMEFDAISKKGIANLLEEHGAIFENEPFVLFPLKDKEIHGGMSTDSIKLLTATS